MSIYKRGSKYWVKFQHAGRMIYKPTAVWNDQQLRWDVWFNASSVLNANERIGHAWSDRLW